MKSYLSDRYQYTVCNGAKSELEIVECGVPQGSTLGPLLFLLYINDLYLFTNFQINLFADDAYLSLSHTCAELLEQSVNAELGKVYSWLCSNKLSLNIKKTTYLVFSRRKSKPTLSVEIGGSKLVQSSSVKYLGVIIDDKLTWKEHIQQVENKVSSGCWALFKLRPYVEREVLLKVYYGLVYQQLQYCISCWGGVPTARLRSLLTLQKRSVRSICNVNRLTPSEPLFRKLKLLKLSDIYVFQISKIMHRFSNNSWVGDYAISSVKAVHSHNTRSSSTNYFHKPFSNNTMKQCLSISGPKVWRNVPDDLKILNYNLFKKAYKSYLIELYNT